MKVLTPMAMAMVVVLATGGTQAATLIVEDARIRPGAVSFVDVWGMIEGESTFGVTIMLELVPRPGAKGSVTFTPSLRAVELAGPVILADSDDADEVDRPSTVQLVQTVNATADIVQLDDAWPGVGTFSAFDTDLAGSPLWNGMVDDNGTFLPEPVTFSGRLARFPITADRGAIGVWEVRLSTRVGASSWEGLETTLAAGTVAVASDACASDFECDDGNPRTADACASGWCRHEPVGNDSKDRAVLEQGDSIGRNSGRRAKRGE